jgi:uncharacterized membrane protein
VERAAASRNPVEWAAARLQAWSEAPPGAMQEARPVADMALVPRRISVADLRDALAAGLSDFLTFRSDVIVLCLMYPLAGAVLWRFATGYNMFHLIFPLIAGFALVGPLFSTGLYEMSRRRERGMAVSWMTAFEAFRLPGIGRIAGLGLILLGVFVAWLLTAQLIFRITLGPVAPASAVSFAHDVLATSRGHLMTILGVDAGAVFAVLVLCTSVISFPLLLDRNVSVGAAVRASVASVRANPRVMAIWGMIVAAGLVIGAAPFLVGLIVTVPVLGHATWHLYRKLLPEG